ncbi:MULTISPECIES: universal stress protein [unclassified Streptomyces]|uniref:universal stress protein n=1 Tax=unclassified Streptomyces TaxID=2593676 RepID=UPI002365AAC7|nr:MULTISPECIES: universal stress protein [unclassified Streptomyces]MDF3140309.1 universal stress protein [Streptomyces sp. T21Q-yed]WDF44105.1 universal stress protein [Streptomyces sp. T12]
MVGLRESGATANPLLEFAFTTAESQGARVRAVRALASAALITHPTSAGHADGSHEAEERARLVAALEPWRTKFPEVSVVEQVTTGPAAHVLMSAATRSRLTVVGRRRHPSHLTWKLGPVAHAALHHLPCPVAVVPHG